MERRALKPLQANLCCNLQQSVCSGFCLLKQTTKCIAKLWPWLGAKACILGSLIGLINGLEDVQARAIVCLFVPFRCVGR